MWNSIQGLRSLMMVSLLLAYVGGLALVYYLVDRHYDVGQPESHSSIQRDLAIRVRAIEATIRLSKVTIDRLAKDPEVVDLLEFGDRAEMEHWATGARRFLPGVLGLALLSPAGEVLGDPDILRVGAACMADIGRIVGGERLRWPVVHRDIPGLEHYDLLAPVVGDRGEPVGFLFVSYTLRQLGAWLELYTFSGEATRLVDQSGYVLAAAGTAPAGATRFEQPFGKFAIRLELDKVAASPGRLRNRLLASSAGLFLLMMVLAGGISTRKWTLVRRDFETVLQNLKASQVAAGEPPVTRSNLRETRQIIFEISQLSWHLAAQREKLAAESRRDPLTGLPNRRSLEEYFDHVCGMVERGAGFRVALVDLDYFKQINDRYGHQAGDQALALFGELVQENLRSSDFAARFAGDEFVLLLFEVAPTPKSRRWVERLATEFVQEQRLRWSRREVTATLSIGTFRMEPSVRVEAAEAMRKADEALYEAKRRGRDQVVDYAELGTPEVDWVD